MIYTSIKLTRIEKVQRIIEARFRDICKRLKNRTILKEIQAKEIDRLFKLKPGTFTRYSNPKTKVPYNQMLEFMHIYKQLKNKGKL